MIQKVRGEFRRWFEDSTDFPTSVDNSVCPSSRLSLPSHRSSVASDTSRHRRKDREKKKSGEVVSYEDMVKMRERVSVLEANQETCRNQRKTLFENISELNKDIDSRVENLMKSIFESKK